MFFPTINATNKSGAYCCDIMVYLLRIVRGRTHEYFLTLNNTRSFDMTAAAGTDICRSCFYKRHHCSYGSVPHVRNTHTAVRSMAC